jgi:regulatory protein YycH of two-component signal transduction system YycFG
MKDFNVAGTKFSILEVSVLVILSVFLVFLIFNYNPENKMNFNNNSSMKVIELQKNEKPFEVIATDTVRCKICNQEYKTTDKKHLYSPLFPNMFPGKNYITCSTQLEKFLISNNLVVLQKYDHEKLMQRLRQQKRNKESKRPNKPVEK